MDNKKGLLILGILGGVAAFFAATRKSSAEAPPEPPPPKTLVSVTVSPDVKTIDIGLVYVLEPAQQYRAWGTFSDGSFEDITNNVAWTSSDTAVASIKPSGIANPVKVGQTYISATLGGISGSGTLTVINSTAGGDGSGPYSFSLRGVNLPSNASGWSAAFFDFAGNSYQRLNDTLILSGENGVENFETPVSELQAVVVVWESNIQGGDGSNSSSTISTTLIPSIIVQNGQTYVFDLSQAHLI